MVVAEQLDVMKMSTGTDDEDNGSSKGFTLTRQTAISISVVVSVVMATAWISTRLENISVRLASLERHGSEPMQSIQTSVATLGTQMAVISKQMTELSLKLEEHMKEKK